MGDRLYFAYGSNLLPQRLRQRTPSARPLGAATLLCHRLRFHKRGRDGSGKCDIEPTATASDAVHGVLYRVALGELGALDAAEDIGRGYDRIALIVEHAGTAREAFSYRARPEAVAPDQLPFDWYLELVIAGARHHRLDEAYVARLELQPSRADPDRSRAEYHRNLLLATERIGDGR